MRKKTVLGLLFDLICLLGWGVSTPGEGKENNSGSVAIVAAYQVGDYVHNYQLHEKVEILGKKTRYELQYHWKIFEHALLLPNQTGEVSIPVDEQESLIPKGSESCIGSFCMDDNIFHGGHGDVWRAHKVIDGERQLNMHFILKRMRVKDRPHIQRCAEREIYFGEYLQPHRYYPRFITYFKLNDDYWLVYKDEGTSLQALIYSVDASASDLLKTSPIWLKMRTTRAGVASMKGILHQVISHTAELHKMGILHRDIKPSNILLNAEDAPRLLVADFSSAVKIDKVRRLYGEFGPTTDEESLSYAPPEVLLAGSDIPYDPLHPYSYDVWSIGVLFLELILGTADVFNVDQRTAAMITQRIGKYRVPADRQRVMIQKALFLASLADYCIYKRSSYGDFDDLSSTSSRRHMQHKHSDAISTIALEIIPSYAADISSSFQSFLHQYYSHENAVGKTAVCSKEDMAQAILRRDPLGKGLQDMWAIDLISKLLVFDPSQRLNLTDALQHAYFRGAYFSSWDRSEHATKQERDVYDQHYILHINEEDLTNTNDDMVDMNLQLSSSVHDYLSPVYPLFIFTTGIDLVLPTAADVEALTFAPSYATTFSTDKVIESMVFQCFQCKRSYKGDWHGCRKHMINRRHGKYCKYGLDKGEGQAISTLHEESNSSTHRIPFTSQRVSELIMTMRSNRLLLSELFPPCLSSHALLPFDKHTGWCDLQGRRMYVEDMHMIYYGQKYVISGVFDGHFGSFAARYSAENIVENLFRLLLDDTSDNVNTPLAMENVKESLAYLNPGINASLFLSNLVMDDEELAACYEGDNEVEFCLTMNSLQNCSGKHLMVSDLKRFLKLAYLDTNHELLERYGKMMPRPRMGDATYIGGSTASLVIALPDQKLVVASAGDSRVIMCCYIDSDEKGHKMRSLKSIQLTNDHTPFDAKEYQNVLERGGFIEGDKEDQSDENTLRVNGKLAVTRSLGDPLLAKYLSAEPEVKVLNLKVDVSGEGLMFDTSANDEFDLCWEYIIALHQDKSQSTVLSRFIPLFLVIGSDGLWDVMKNDEVIQLVCADLLTLLSKTGTADENKVALSEEAYQVTSQHLAQEALLRGSSDNIGVCVMELSHTSN